MAQPSQLPTYPVSSQNHAARHHAILSSRPFVFPPAALCSRTPFAWQTTFHTHTQQQPIERSAHAACVLLPCCLQVSSVNVCQESCFLKLKAVSVAAVAVLGLTAHWSYCEVSVLVWHDAASLHSCLVWRCVTSILVWYDAASLPFLCGMTLRRFHSCLVWRCVTSILVWYDAASLLFLFGMTLRHFHSCVAWRCVAFILVWYDAASLRNQLPTFRKT